VENLAEIKQRILFYLKNQRIKKEDFYNKIGANSSNFRGKSLKSELSGDTIAKISTIYPEINPDWLLTGKGEMLRNVKTADVSSESTTIKENNVTTLISILNRTLAEKDKQIDRLLSIIETTNKQKK